jgi:hypothetical protein
VHAIAGKPATTCMDAGNSRVSSNIRDTSNSNKSQATAGSAAAAETRKSRTPIATGTKKDKNPDILSYFLSVLLQSEYLKSIVASQMKSDSYIMIFSAHL